MTTIIGISGSAAAVGFTAGFVLRGSVAAVAAAFTVGRYVERMRHIPGGAEALRWLADRIDGSAP